MNNEKATVEGALIETEYQIMILRGLLDALRTDHFESCQRRLKKAEKHRLKFVVL